MDDYYPHVILCKGRENDTILQAVGPFDNEELANQWAQNYVRVTYPRYSVVPCMSTDTYLTPAHGEINRWEDDNLQFPRLLAEIMAVDIGESAWDELMGSMDITSDELESLFNRAQNRWEEIKARTT